MSFLMVFSIPRHLSRLTLLLALWVTFPGSSVAQGTLPLGPESICPPDQAIFRFDVEPSYMLLNTGPGKCFKGVVRSPFDGSVLYTVKGERVEPGSIRLFFSQIDDGLKFSMSYNYKQLPPGARSPFAPKGLWSASDRNTGELSHFETFYVVWEQLYGEFYLREDRDRDLTLSDSALFEGASDNMVTHLFRNEVAQLIAGLPPFTFGPEPKTRCEKREGPLKTLLQSAGGWTVDVKGGGYNSVTVVLKSHSDDHYFYQTNTWWQAFLKISFDETKGCKLMSLTLYDSEVCAGPHNANPIEKHLDCWVRPRIGSDAEFRLRDAPSLVAQICYRFTCGKSEARK